MRVYVVVFAFLLSSFSPLLMAGADLPPGIDIEFRNGSEETIAIEAMIPGHYTGFWVLAHEYPVPSEWVHDLADAGVECWSFLPPTAFHCELSGQTPLELAHLGVQGMLEMSPKAKLHPSVIPALNGEEEVWMMTTGIGVVNLVLSGDDLPEGIEDRADISVLSHSWRWAKVEAQTSGIHWLIQQSEVEWVEPQFEQVILNDVADDVISANVLQSALLMAGIDGSWNALDGTGIIVAVADTGLDNGVNNTNMHPDFKDHIVDIQSYWIPSSQQSFVNAPYDDGAADLDTGHGTHVAGSVLGDGTQSTGAIKGIAPEARLYMQATEVYTDWTTATENNYGVTDGYTLMGIPSDLSDMFDEAAANGSNIHTNSWGSSVAGQYTTSSMQADHSARNHSGMLILFAASNDGVDGNNDGEIDLDSLGAPSTAKNVLTVGASENDRSTFSPTWGSWWPGDYPSNPINSDNMEDDPEGMAAFSSRGPADDGRTKPDVVAPGTFILSTKSRSTSATGWSAHSNSDYTYMGGTSMATPITAGASALIYQHLIDNLAHTNPSSALVKGIFAASAHDMAGQYSSSTNGAGETAPNEHEGWGIIDLDRAVNSTFVDGDTVSTSETLGWKFTVPASAPDLKVMLSWTDPASTPAASTNLVNDLDFALKDPSGNWVEYGNNLDNLIGGTISSPAQGLWEVHVNGTNVPTGPQAFALVLDAPYSLTNLSADADGDGYEDDVDDCPSTAGTSTLDQTGCPDGDGDGWSNVGDDFPNDSTQWSDSDGDGFGDNPGGNTPDGCTSVVGSSSTDRYGCIDTDGDGWSDPDGGWTTFEGADACPTEFGNSTLDRNGCIDNDGDGQSNASDVLENDSSQWLDSDGDTYFDNANPATNWDDCPSVWGNSTSDLQGCVDSDGDGMSDINDQWPNDPSKSEDSDGDGFDDGEDDCPNTPGNSTIGLLGCEDADGDGRPIGFDEFPTDGTQWNDTDGDGYGDEATGNLADDCPNTFGESWQNGTLGCPDADADGWADSEDSFDADETQWHDIDGDGYGDNIGGLSPDSCPSEWGNSTEDGVLGCIDSDGDGWADSIDALPLDPTQNADSDGDGYGDDPTGTDPDECPNTPGTSTIDRLGCPDSDGDGYSDLNDAFPDDANRSIDTDQDGYDDLEDDCPNTAGSSTNGSLGCFDADQDTWADANDSFPLEPTQWADSDSDGYGDNTGGFEADDCPTIAGNSSSDVLGCIDDDGDTYSNTGDEFPADGSEWLDSDSDGFGDNSDFCPLDAGTALNGSIGCLDSDSDSWSDDVDFLVNDSSQNSDSDGDGYGDNSAGTNGDSCPSIAGTSTEDVLGCYDEDGDGWSDSGDSFPSNPSQQFDNDSDGYGDNHSAGAQQADHWPLDPTRNVAEVEMTCSEASFNVDIATDSSIAFTCTITNGIQNELTVMVELMAINSLDAAVRTHVLILDGNESQTIAFAGQIDESGTHTLVIEASELGSTSSMAFASASVTATDSSDGSLADDILEAAEEIPHLTEIVAISMVLLLLMVLIGNARNRKKRDRKRDTKIQEFKVNRYIRESGNNNFGRLPPGR